GELVERGLEPAVAAEQAALEQVEGVPWERIVGDWRAGAIDGLERREAVQVLGSFSVPIAGRIVASLGAQSLDFVRASASRAAVQLRVRGDVSLAAVVTSLAADGVTVSALRFASHGLQIEGRANLHATRAFKGGQIEVQDEGSQLLAELVDASGAERIVDVCAGAGGKTLALASAAPQAKILAMDVRARALSELQIRANRAGALRVKAVKLPPTGNFPAQVRGWSADRVLVDSPCSGLGTLRRHPEQRLRLTESALDELSQLQRQILARSATLVRVGGRLVYGTCSVLGSENEGVVEQFLAMHPDFRQVSAAEVFGPERAEAIGVGDVMRLSPHTHGTDGFFGAVLERVV
ncbi:MAG: RsmB/NOP family class I SAM-dependent RNA methyltransferase, partial [Myxococcota bacterium]